MRELGEFGLIERIAALSRQQQSARGVVLGIGDDAALLRPRAGEDIVVSTDCSVEDVHFSWRHDAAAAIGRRALVASLSDLAAMGARPLGCTLALAVPAELEVRRLDGALRGLVREAGERGCPLVGGNISAARETSFTLTVLGSVARGRALRRDAARVGDALFVTGALGRSALARRRAQRSGRPGRFVPEPRLEAGRALSRLGVRVACIDLSDGLAADLRHLLAPRGLGADLESEALPRPRGFESACAAAGLDPLKTLSAGGEDYELLFALGDPWAGTRRLAELSKRLGLALSRIGRVSAVPGIRGLPGGGWRHFAATGRRRKT